jgi:hypothetical protein
MADVLTLPDRIEKLANVMREQGSFIFHWPVRWIAAALRARGIE